MPAGCEVGARRRKVAKKSAHGSVSEGGGGTEGADTDDTQPLGQRVEPNRVDCAAPKASHVIITPHTTRQTSSPVGLPPARTFSPRRVFISASMRRTAAREAASSTGSSSFRRPTAAPAVAGDAGARVVAVAAGGVEKCGGVCGWSVGAGGSGRSASASEKSARPTRSMEAAARTRSRTRSLRRPPPRPCQVK